MLRKQYPARNSLHIHWQRYVFFWKISQLWGPMENLNRNQNRNRIESELLRLRWHASVCQWLLASCHFYSPRQVVTKAASLITHTQAHTLKRHTALMCEGKVLCVCQAQQQQRRRRRRSWTSRAEVPKTESLKVACAKETSTEPERKWPIRVGLHIPRQRCVYLMLLCTWLVWLYWCRGSQSVCALLTKEAAAVNVERLLTVAC